MRPLLKVMGTLFAVLLAVFVAGWAFGILSTEKVRSWLEWADAISPWYIAFAVISLLSIDLVLAVPTLTTTLLSGYFLGFPVGMLVAFTGITIAALVGYWSGWRFGDRLSAFIVRDPEERARMTEAFERDGPVMILLSRGAPLLPEVTACMAGANRMKPGLFLLLHVASTLPYVALVTYVGSISRTHDPKPAILAAAALYAVLWVVWLVRRNWASIDRDTGRDLVKDA